MAKYLDDNGLLYFWQKIRTTFVSDIAWDSTNKKLQKKKKTGTSGAEETTDLVTFATVATSGSYNDLSNKPTIPVLQNVFGKVKVGSTTIEADTTQDTLELIAGDNVTLTPNATNDSVTIAATDTTYSDASGSAHGLMTAAHYTKLEGIASGAEVNVQANWSESSSSSDAYIQNKPTLGSASAKDVVTEISADSNDVPTVTAVKGYVATAITGASSFQGTAPTTFAPTNYKKGMYWVVGTAGTYVGETCEAGDMIFAIADYSSAYSASDFDVIQTNLDISAISNGEIDTVVAA